MNIIIEIECETITDLYTHLRVLQQQIKKQTRDNKLNPLNDEFAVGTSLYDDNCYGSHQLDVVHTETITGREAGE